MDTAHDRVGALLDWALPILCDIHPLAGMLVRAQAEQALNGMSEGDLLMQAERMRALCTYIIEGGAFPTHALP